MRFLNVSLWTLNFVLALNVFTPSYLDAERQSKPVDKIRTVDWHVNRDPEPGRKVAF